MRQRDGWRAWRVGVAAVLVGGLVVVWDGRPAGAAVAAGAAEAGGTAGAAGTAGESAVGPAVPAAVAVSAVDSAGAPAGGGDGVGAAGSAGVSGVAGVGVEGTAAAAAPGEGAVSPEVEREARAYGAGSREPAVIEHADVVEVPFGHQGAVLECAPLRVCLIELEEGELVLNTVTGDAARWILDRAAAGPLGRTPVLVAKPTACNLTTNLVVTTDRRIYQITLDARPCRSEAGENPHEPFTRRLRFYYPDQLVRTWASSAAARQSAAAAEARAVVPLGASVPLAELHFNYRFTRTARYPWTPVAIFDDGVHTYIRLPGSGAGQELPVLFLVDEKGALGVLNYAVQGQTYVTDRVVDRAALVLGSGKGQERLEITRVKGS